MLQLQKHMMEQIGLEGPATLSSPRSGINGGGNSVTSTFAAQGNPTYNLTEEFNKSANVITAAAWASAPSISTGRYLLVGAGSTYNAKLLFLVELQTQVELTEHKQKNTMEHLGQKMVTWEQQDFYLQKV